MRRRVSPTLRSERMLRKGDCPSCTASACFRASSKTASPVLLSKSATTTVSLSVSGVAFVTGVADRERQERPPAIRAAASTIAAGTRTFQSFPPATGTSATFNELDDGGGASAGEEVDAGDDGWGT